MKVILVLMFCGGRFCNFEPTYVIKYDTEEGCIKEANKANTSGNLNVKAFCVPEVKRN